MSSSPSKRKSRTRPLRSREEAARGVSALQTPKRNRDILRPDRAACRNETLDTRLARRRGVLARLLERLVPTLTARQEVSSDHSMLSFFPAPAKLFHSSPVRSEVGVTDSRGGAIVNDMRRGIDQKFDVIDD